MPDPFSPAGRFEQRQRDADQQRAQEAERRKAADEGREPAAWARMEATAAKKPGFWQRVIYDGQMHRELFGAWALFAMRVFVAGLWFGFAAWALASL